MNKMDTSENPDPKATEDGELIRARVELLRRLDGWLETPMLILAFVWLALLIVELIWGESLLFNTIGTIIWVVFLVDFAVTFVLAPHKVAHLKRNWLTAISLLLPALRIFRIFRVFRLLRLARAGRGLRLIRVVSSLNRGMNALSASLSRRGFGYVSTLTVLVTLAGAAGMYTFENETPGGFNSYGDALWWAAMIMTTLGSQHWPQTPEGRVLCVFLALYAFGVFGYVTAALATFFVGRDAAELPGAKELAALRDELSALRNEIPPFRGARPGDGACRGKLSPRRTSRCSSSRQSLYAFKLRCTFFRIVQNIFELCKTRTLPFLSRFCHLIESNSGVKQTGRTPINGAAFTCERLSASHFRHFTQSPTAFRRWPFNEHAALQANVAIAWRGRLAIVLRDVTDTSHNAAGHPLGPRTFR